MKTTNKSKKVKLSLATIKLNKTECSDIYFALGKHSHSFFMAYINEQDAQQRKVLREITTEIDALQDKFKVLKDSLN